MTGAATSDTDKMLHIPKATDDQETKKQKEEVDVHAK
jgi:hypothetical protein